MVECGLLMSNESLRQLFVENNDSEEMRDFLLDVLCKTKSNSGGATGVRITEQVTCKYHVHADKESSYSCTAIPNPLSAECGTPYDFDQPSW